MAQVGVKSKAQKYSRNNYCEIFQLSHSAKNTRKGLPQKQLLFWTGNQKKQKKSKKSHIAENPETL